MFDILGIFNNRELAVVIWTAVFFIWVLFAVPNIHKSLWSILCFSLWYRELPHHKALRAFY